MSEVTSDHEQRERPAAMHRSRLLLLTVALAAVPTPAYALTGGEVPEVLSLGAGAAALVAAIGLLAGILAVAKIAEGAAIAQHIQYAVLAVICMTAAVLAGWLSRWLPSFSAEHTRLAADLLLTVAMALFGVYFVRVRLAMSRFLKRLTGEEQLLTIVVDAAAADGE